MQLEQILKPELINADLSAKSRDEALAEMVETVIRSGVEMNKSSIVDILKQREQLGSTGIGEGIAIPHGKTAAVNRIIVAFGRSTEGISYDALDGKPVHLLFLLLAPENSAGQHLKILAKISRMLKEADFRQKLLDASSQMDLHEIILAQENICGV